MKTTSVSIYFLRTAFLIGLFCTSCCFADSWHPQFFWSIETREIKTLLAFLVPCILTLAVYLAERSLDFLSGACAVMMNVCLLLFFIDRYTVNLIARIGQDKIIFHFMYSLISFFTVLVTAWACSVLDPRRRGGFALMYRRFALGYLPLCIFLFILQFFVLRQFGNIGVTSNFIPFDGEIRCLLFYAKNGTLTATTLLHSAGNVLYFTSLSVALCGIFKKHPAVWGTLIPVFLSIFIESFQYLTKSGDADVDDIILNTLGALLGTLAYTLFIKNSMEEKACLE